MQLYIYTSLQEGATTTQRFAASVGKGLDIGVLQHAKNSLSSLSPITLECPAVLEVRQLLQFSPVTEQTRSRFDITVNAILSHLY